MRHIGDSPLGDGRLHVCYTKLAPLFIATLFIEMAIIQRH